MIRIRNIDLAILDDPVRGFAMQANTCELHPG